MPGIIARNVLIQLVGTDSTDPVILENINSFASDRQASVLVTVLGEVLFCSSQGSKISLKSGVQTLKDTLCLSHLPTRINHFKNLPDDFLLDLFPNGYDESKIRQAIGDKFEKAFVSSVINRKLEKVWNSRRNNHIFDAKRTTDLLQDGTITAENYRRVRETKKQVERDLEEENPKPDLDGDYEMTFEQWLADPMTKIPYKTGTYPAQIVRITGRPGDRVTKQKHYYFYSKSPGFGKTCQLMLFAENYNAHFVSDIKNWVDIPAGWQFLIFEEVGFDCKLSFNKMKAFTSGRAGGASGNCKSYGDSYKPREDVQLIMLSNESPFDVYGTWNAKLQRRLMSKDIRNQFLSRFEVFRLDGDVTEDLVACMAPSDWTEEQFEWEFGQVFEAVTDKISKKGIRTTQGKIVALIDYMERAKQLLEAKYNEGSTQEAFIAILNRCCGITVPGLKIVWEEMVKALYSVDGNKKRKGRAFLSQLDRLVEKEELKQRGLYPSNENARLSIKAEKRIDYSDMGDICDVLYDNYTKGVDQKTAKKRAWDQLGACFHEPTFFECMTLGEIVQYVIERPNAVKRLLSTCYSPYPMDMDKCMAIHCRNQAVTELDKDMFRRFVYEPLLRLWAKNKDVWTDEENEEDKQDEEEPIPKYCKSNVQIKCW